MILLIFGLLLCCFFSFIFFSSYYSFSRRFNSFKLSVYSLVSSVLPSFLGSSILLFVFLFLLAFNLFGNIPLNRIPTMFYRVTFTVRLLLWIPIIICVSLTQLKRFVAHLFPYGSPIFLLIILPLVELFSQIIRPLTLIIRLRTNLSSGHIIVYMFSYFTLLSSLLSPFIYLVLYILVILEFFISLLQAYIFVSLVSLYIAETI